MTLFAKFGTKSGLRPALLCAAFVSLTASTALAGNPAPAPKSHGVVKNASYQKTGYRPRHRIATHPRNRNRVVQTYSRGARKVRVVDTSTSTQKAPKTGFNAHRSGGVDHRNRFERLKLRYLRESIDAVGLENARIRAAEHFTRRSGNGGVFDTGLVPARGFEYAPASPSEGILTEVANDGPLRPSAGIIRVTQREKIIGEERAAARSRRFNRENSSRYIRFYRDNEAYDVRFPSVVYLTSR